jgi:hypothetical protein
VKINVEGEVPQHVQNPLLGEVSSMSTGLDSPSLMDVLACVMQERQRQDTKWGEQNHPDFQPVIHQSGDKEEIPVFLRPAAYGIPSEYDARERCDRMFKEGRGNWGDILVEEISESFGTTDEAKLEEGLIQSAAVIVAWVQCIRRRRERR